MSAFTLLWHSILRSSLWIKGSKETRLVWITLLAMKDADGVVTSSMIGLADIAKLTVEECREAVKELSSPDPDDTSKVDEGRRIREVRGGWQIINHEYYRFTTEAKREFWRQQKAEQRAAAQDRLLTKKLKATGRQSNRMKKMVRNNHLPREDSVVRALNRGDERAADYIENEHL